MAFEHDDLPQNIGTMRPRDLLKALAKLPAPLSATNLSIQATCKKLNALHVELKSRRLN